MDAAEALTRLIEDSSQVERAVVLEADGTVVGSTEDTADVATNELARAALDVLAAAGDLHSSSGEVTQVEVELAEGGLFVLREGMRTIAATTGPSPTAALVVYDLRTCLHGIADEAKPKRRRARKKTEEDNE